MVATYVTPNITQNTEADAQISDKSEATNNPQFVFAACQHGTEANLKSRLTGSEQPFRLAFSRPGLLTFKVVAPETSRREDDGSPEQPGRTLVELPSDILIRQAGIALGQLRGEQAEKLVGKALQLAGSKWDVVHVFARDTALPGDKGFEPGPSELCRVVSDCFARAMPDADVSGEQCSRGASVLDVVLVAPNQWIVGHHRADAMHQRWPGGSFPIVVPEGMISRAYLKMAEALAWSQLAVEPGDRFVEIGSSPGGACQRLLDLGLKVTGIDPAEMDIAVMNHPRFDHWRGKSSSIKRKRYSKFRWLAADANVAPNYTLDAVEDIVKYPTSHFEGLLLTLKLSSYDLVDHVPDYLSRVRGWGFGRVDARQLSFNRRECCVVAQR